jgi:hypothetical protein
MRMNVAISFLLLLVVVAGCMGAENGDQEPDAGTSSSPTNSEVPNPGLNTSVSNEAEAASGFAPFAIWSGCAGFRTSIAGLTSMYNFAPTPPGWESDNPTTDFDLRFFTCERISWGAFERGPVHMLLELGTNFEVPPTCIGERATLSRDMSSWWFSDPDVAEFVREVYGANAFATNFTIAKETTGEVVDESWAWGLPGKPSSHVRFPGISGPTDSASHVTRVFWFVDNGTYAMDFSQEWQMEPPVNHGSAFRPAAGRLEEPMLYATAGDQNDFAGRSERYLGMEIAADFFRFGDYQCTEPL